MYMDAQERHTEQLMKDVASWYLAKRRQRAPFGVIFYIPNILAFLCGSTVRSIDAACAAETSPVKGAIDVTEIPHVCQKAVMQHQHRSDFSTEKVLIHIHERTYKN